MSGSITDSGHDTSSFDQSSSSNVHPSLTVGRLPHANKAYAQQVDVLPKLPSHKFRYSVWHDLRETCLTGDQLHAPRVRSGPPEKEKYFSKIEEEGLPIHHDRQGSNRKAYMNEHENWEEADTINLCYQDLCDGYQWANFYRILERCRSAKIINLSHNHLVDVGRIKFPSCEYINLNFNYLKSFKGFPSLPKIKSITARTNAIQTVAGLSKLAGSGLEDLDLRGNPICFILNYRQTIFGVLPNLRVLDGIPKLPNDSEIIVPEDKDGGCTIL